MRKKFKGKNLVGKKYEPPFSWLKEQDFDEKDKAWTIYHADYVELGEEGTGAVHLAPAYGEDDMNLAKEHGVPIVHHVDEAGHFKDFVTDFAGMLVKPKDDDESEVTHLDADIEIVKTLKANGTLFKKENITHSYPHCWRCDTPLLNYATTSWFVDVPSIKDQLVEENSKVHWVPEHVGKNRFGKWLEGARDWAVSRQRYWGAPLPIWRNPETKEYKVFGSHQELQEYVPKQGNAWHITRHGESYYNTIDRLSSDAENTENTLTEQGVAQSKALGESLREDGIDYIYYSPLVRTKETARVVAETLGLSSDRVISDERLYEMRFGVYEDKTVEEYHALFPTGKDRLTVRPEGGETWAEVKQRVGDFLFTLHTKHQNDRILIVSHNGTLQMIQAVAAGDVADVIGQHIETHDYNVANAEVRPLEFTPYPHNDDYELDFHRPYIDEIALYDGKVKLERVPDVFDCWFESGSMPYAQLHYPFEYAETFEQKYFPANFISESIDQTRGWFYSTLVLGVALFGKSPFENVVTNGLVLAEDGRKMSKSLQNYPDPMELVARQGADAMRFYLLSSSIIKAEDLNFSEKEVQELQRKNIGRLHNVLAMYEQYSDGSKSRSDSEHVLDCWIIARLNQLVADTTAGYKNYELDKATRPITDFIDDVSVWYLRRSRDRLKGDDAEDKQATLATLRYVLQNLALVMAPVMPFYAEYLWQRVKEDDDAESVHLAAWPEGGEVDEKILEVMSEIRRVVTEALEKRTKEKLKVRQPLNKLTIRSSVPAWGSELMSLALDIVRDELNVKEVVKETITSGEEIILDTNLTPELLAEGAVRELMRAVQGKRKTEGLAPEDRIILTVQTEETGQAAIEASRTLLTNTVGASELVYAETEGEVVAVNDLQFTFAIKTS